MKQTRIVIAIACVCGSFSVAHAQRGSSETEALAAVQTARGLVKRGKLAKAAAHFQRALRLDASLTSAYEGYSFLLFVQKRYQKGEQLVRRGLKSSGKSSILRAQLAMHLYGQKKYRAAGKLFKQTQTALAERFEIQALAARCCLRVRDYECAVKAYRSFLAHRPRSLAKRDYRARAGLALALLGNKDARGALREARLSLGQKQGYARASVAKARAQYALGQCDSALLGYKALKSKLGARYRLHAMDIGRVELCLRHYRSALEQAEIALSVRRNDQDALLLKSDALMGLRRYHAAVAILLAVHNRDKANRGIALRLAGAYFRTKQYARASKVLAPFAKRADADGSTLILALRSGIGAKSNAQVTTLTKRLARLAKASKDTKVLLYVGRGYAFLKRYAKALVFYKRGLKLDARFRPLRRSTLRVQARLARAAYLARKHQTVVRLMKDSLALDPSSFAARRNLALSLLALDKPAEALKHCKVILARVARDYVANRLAGRAISRAGRAKEAQRYFEQAVSSVLRHPGPALARALSESAANRVQLGQAEQAFLELERASALLAASTQPATAALKKHVVASLARLRLARAIKALNQGKPLVGWKELSAFKKLGAELTTEEKAAAGVAVVLGAVAVRNVIEASRGVSALPKKAAKLYSKKRWRTIKSLLAAYVGALSAGPKKRLKAAGGMQRAARRLSPKAKAAVGKVVATIYQQVAVRYLAANKARLAQRTLSKARKTASSAQYRHNVAVADFLLGKKTRAEKVLRELVSQLPLALCNLGVLYDRAGKPRKALDLYQRCQKQRVAFPDLAKIVNAKRRLYSGGVQ
jgi:tetratricopeptide (TPR) repeat protein